MKMETFAYDQPKLQENKNAALAYSAIYKLVEIIKKKISGGSVNKDLEELKHLKDQCGSDDPLMSVTACQGFVHLVKSCMFPLSNAVSALVASLFSVKSVTGVVSALTDLLILEMQSLTATGSGYTCPYNTRSPQHPLISVVKRRPQAWPDVLNQISAICNHPDKQVEDQSLALVKPVLLYIITEGNDLPSGCRLQVFGMITNYFADSEFVVEALAACLCWEDGRVLEAVDAVTLVCKQRKCEGSLLALACLLRRLVSTGHSPRPTLRVMSSLAPGASNTHSTLLALLADSISHCPATYLDCLLTFLVELLSLGQCSPECAWMCISSLLPWLASEPSFLQSALHSASLMMAQVTTCSASASSTASLLRSPAVVTVLSADPALTQAIHIARLSEVLHGDVSGTLQWLGSLAPVESHQVWHYVSALLVSHDDAAVRLAALQVLISFPVTTNSLFVLLYQLAREKQPDVQLALLRALPATAVNKGNVAGVLSTLEALRRSGRRHLGLLAVGLYCRLWQSQERCYSQLMDILLDQSCYDNEPALGYVLRAAICKTICTDKAEQHGKEVVAMVSDILNKCGGSKDSVASSLALEALVPLCRHDVVDVYSIWRSLYPRFSRDKRPLVLKSLCELVSVASVQKSSSAGVKTLNQMLAWLWNLVGSNKEAAVVEAALLVLSKFHLDLMNLKMIPEGCRKGITLPPEMAKTPVDAARKPEDVLNYIAGECWIQVVRHVGAPCVSHAIGNWIKMEVASFRGGMYQVDRQEPTSYSYLSQASVVRGITTSLQLLWKARKEEDVLCLNLCLEALAQTSIKPLPSLSWAFLGDPCDLNNTQLTNSVVRLAAKQSQISPSARKIVENFIAKSENDPLRIEFLYSILTSSCRGIPPVLIRPFLEKTLFSAVKHKDKQLPLLLNAIKLTLREEKIHDANRTVLNQQVRLLSDVLEPQHEFLAEYFECASELPASMIESMSSTSLMWEVTSDQLQKAFRLRAFMALLPNASLPLNWMNEVIEVSSTNIAEQSLALSLLSDVVTKLRGHTTAWSWLQELMGQIHETANSGKSGFDFLVTVFVLCVDIFSGYSNFATNDENSRGIRFPQAITSLVTKYGDAKNMVEWLNFMTDVNSFPSEYVLQFQLAARNISLHFR